MKPNQKRAVLAVGIAGLLLAGAGSAIAASHAGPPAGAPGYGMQDGRGGGYGVMAGGVIMDAAAEYIGISETQLMAERHAGTSLAQIATAHGKSVSGLEAALVSAFKTSLDKAVAAGRITEAQAAQALASFKTQVSSLVQRTATGPMGGRGGGMMGSGNCPRR